MCRHLALASLVAASLGSAATAFAADNRSFSLAPASLHIEGTAVAGPTVILPKSGTSTFNISFVVPLDHQPDTRILVNVYMQHPAAGPCTAATRLGSVARRRLNKVRSFTVTPNIDRVEPAGGVEATSFAATASTVARKTYIVRTPMAASFTGLRASDGINLSVDRVSTDAADTCSAQVLVAHVEITYTSVDAAP
jgi:hypothetical protein